MPILLAALYVLFLSTVAHAESVEVRSGQHDGFTRLILALPERVDFKITNNADEANIFFADQTLTFDTSPVFRRIGRERIADISPGKKPASLRIEFGCDCEVSSFWHEKSLLVLDVTNIELREDVAEFVPVETEMPPSAVIRPRVSLKRDDIPVFEALSLPQSSSPATSGVSENGAMVESAPMPNVPDENTIAEARDRLLEQLSRAASQGLLSPRRDFDPRAKSDRMGNSDDVEDDQQQAEDHSTGAFPLDHVNLQAQSSIDRDFLDTLENRARHVLGNVCLDDELLDVASWGTEVPFAQQVGPKRIALMEEFDKPNQKTALELAKLYLFFGFGEEAQQLISLLPDDTKARRVLSDLALIMQLRHANQPSVLFNQLNCEGLASLWSALSHETLPSDTPINHKAIQRSFAALPSHLRSYLGPVLSRRLLDAGLTEAADGILRNLKRHADTGSPNAQLVDAELDLKEKNDASALDKLDQVVGSNSEPSAEAVVSLIDTAIRSDESVSYEHAVLAGAYLQQNRGGDLETGLARAYLTGLSASGAFEQAYKEKTRLEGELPSSLMTQIESEMLDHLTQRADDISFVRYALADHSNGSSIIEPEVANAAADKLLSLGFAPQAQAFVSSETTGNAMRDRQVIRARISLAMGRPLQAEADLLTLSGEDADLLRAAARNQLGDHRAATALFLSSGEEQKALRQAWLAEDWAFLENTDDALLTSAAALASLGNSEDVEGDTTAEGERVLANNRGLLQQSASTRDTLVNILQNTPTP